MQQGREIKNSMTCESTTTLADHKRSVMEKLGRQPWESNPPPLASSLEIMWSYCVWVHVTLSQALLPDVVKPLNPT